MWNSSFTVKVAVKREFLILKIWSEKQEATAWSVNDHWILPKNRFIVNFAVI